MSTVRRSVNTEQEAPLTGMDAIPSTVELTACMICGRTDRVTILKPRHFFNGEICKSVMVDAVFKLTSVVQRP